MSTDASGFDQYQRIQIQGVSSVDGTTPQNIEVNPTTGAMQVEASIDTTGLATTITDTNTTTIAGDTTSIDAKTPALGQALAAASVPVVLTAAQLTTLTPVSTVTADTELPAAAALSDATANPTAPMVGGASMLWNSSNWVRAGIMSNADNDGGGLNAQLTAATMRVFDGTNWDRARGDSTDGLLVNLGTNNDVTVTNATAANLKAEVTVAAAQTLATVTTVSTLSNTTQLTPGTAAANLGKAEDAGHTSADVGVFALGVRNDTLADVTNATADYSQLSTDLKGRVVTTSTPRALKTQQITTITASTSETTVLTAVASTFLDVYGVIVVNSSATASNISFKDSTAGTTRFNIYVPAGETRGFMLSPDAAVTQAAVNSNWTATSSASVSSIIITMLAVKMV